MSMGAGALATLLPWVAGFAWMRWLYRENSDAALALQVGYGFFIGLAATALAVRVLSFAGTVIACLMTAAFLVAASVVALFLIRRLPVATGHGRFSSWWTSVASWQRVVLIVLLVSMFLHAGVLAIEAWSRPLFAWDAWMHWTPKAKVWTELGNLAAFGSRWEWLESGGEVYTIRNWRYPEFVPLVQMWVAVASGGWNDRVINLPWFGAYLALLASLYGQLRRLGYGVLGAVTVVWMLGSLPVLNIHVALPGYADLWLGAFLALSVAALLVWARERDPRDLGLAILCCVVLAWIKIPGLAWLAVMIPALAVAILPLKVTLATGGALVFIGGVILSLGGIGVTVPGLGQVTLSLNEIELPVVGQYALEWRGVGRAFLRQTLVDPGWHMTFYLFPAALLLGLWRARVERDYLAAFLVVLMSAGFLFLALLLTGRSAGVETAQTTHRALLHAVPALAVALAVMAAPAGIRPRPRSRL